MSDRFHAIRQNPSVAKSIYKLIDVSAVALGLLLLLQWVPELNSRSTLVSFLMAAGLFSLMAELVGLYRNWQGICFEREATCSVIAWIGTFSLLFVVGSFSQYTTEFSKKALLLWCVFTPLVSLSGRIVFRQVMFWLIKRGVCSRTFAVVGINDLAIRLVRNIESNPELGLRFMGFFDDRPEARTIDLPTDLKNRLGSIENLLVEAKSNGVSVVYITLPMRAEDRIRDLIEKLSDSTLSVYVVPDLFVFQLLHSRWTDIQGVPVVSVFENPFYGVDGLLKRVSDVVLASLVIVAAAIPMLIIALLVRCTSRGPILFRQRRYGLDGNEFFVWKFRSMTVCEDGTTVTQAKKHDVRLTRVGGFLRRSSLDELPQLFNVLAGTMSLVGPRPHATAHNEQYRGLIDGYMLRHKVKPGITGLAQVNGCRGETETLDKMENRVIFDHQYIREWTIWMDLKIMWQTVSVVFSKENAH